MSYDLMVFDPEKAPVEREAFLAWHREQTHWEEEHGYNDAGVTSPKLRAWFDAMIKTFPPMNGPLRSKEADDPNATDYSIGRSIIYAGFAWSKAEAAYAAVRRLAAKHRVGFFDVSGEHGEIWRPKPWWKLW